ncbi:hypothetical protein E2C01_063304 [Portunus trituberculatus]|uniref:Uncharacterized protein n=1 Tax=Portunus trituberculatus TaxID=210409 RepID=A0A5B7HH77_PORTR|nr:hypothetical protein [Portunus trituberculatus]
MQTPSTSPPFHPASQPARQPRDAARGRCVTDSWVNGELVKGNKKLTSSVLGRIFICFVYD